jgi:hypothetical protein
MAAAVMTPLRFYFIFSSSYWNTDGWIKNTTDYDETGCEHVYSFPLENIQGVSSLGSTLDDGPEKVDGS